MQPHTGSPRFRILNLEPEGYSAKAKALLDQCGTVTDGPLSRDALLGSLTDYDILIVRLAHQIDKEVIEAGPRLKAIVSATTGLDHIDLQAAEAKRIAVLSLRGEEEFLRRISATAELTWGLLLALMRRIPEAVMSVQAGDWSRDSFKGRDLEGRRLGIVGVGRVGRRIAEFGSAFRMQVAGYDPHATGWPAAVQRKPSLNALLAETDVLSIHVNLHSGTVGLIGRQELQLLPRGAVVINTSRGAVVDEDALLEALVSGHVYGAATDVVTHERDEDRRRANPLIVYSRTHHHALITPHIGGVTEEAMCKTEVFMAKKLVAFLAPSEVATVS